MLKKSVFVLACVLCGGIALAGGPSTFVEVALIDGGENGRNGGGDQSGYEATGDYSFGDHWYVGGVLGRFTRDFSGGDVKNTYFNAHGGYLFPIAEGTSVILEGGLWFGNQDNGNADDTNPGAFEIKAGATRSLSEKFDIFATLAWVNGDTDDGDDSNLRNYVWSLGGAFRFGDHWSINLKIVNGVNGVNGQDQVLRFAGRYTF